MKKENQSGRSMIEMLGVLAIIGVLSIGALYGLRTAQNKYRANAIISDVMLAAADLLPRQEALTASTTINTFSFTPKNSLTAEKCATDNVIEVVVSNVPEGVCKKIMNIEKIKGISGFGLGNNSNFCDNSVLSDTCATGNNKIVFLLNKYMNIPCNGQYCDEDQYCSYDTTATSCSDSGAGQCVSKGNFPTNSVTLSRGTVYISPNGMNWWSAQSYCESHGLSLLSGVGLCGWDPFPSKTWTCCTKSGNLDQSKGSGNNPCFARNDAVNNTSTAPFAFADEFKLLWSHGSLKGDWAWLKETSTDCNAYCAEFSMGRLVPTGKLHASLRALCVDD